MASHQILLQRIYDSERLPGSRVLVDRLWPRGVKKEAAALDLWAKEATPSSALRIWYHSHPEEFKEFSSRYLEELRTNPKAAEFASWCRKKLETEDVILLFATRKKENHIQVLKAWLEEKLSGEP